MRLDKINALMKGDTRTYWFYPVGVIDQGFAPYFPGPDLFYQMSTMQFLVLKEC